MAAPNDGPALAALDREDKYHVPDEKVPAGDEASSDVLEDDAHAGLEFPTEEERLTLRRVADALPWSSYCTPTYFSLYISSP